NHYVVLTKVRKSSYVVHDPALGKRIIGLQEMSGFVNGMVASHLLCHSGTINRHSLNGALLS
ncbi:hypothetical protein JTL69_35045, partial [Pseudomonas aeruginosa]|nr:hypothetical protein [Pseudomonas aeruginosa]